MYHTTMAGDAFQKFKTSVNRGFNTISAKASSSLEKAKLKAKMDSLTKEIDKLYRKIGEKAYLLWNDGQELQVLEEAFAAVRLKKEEKERLKAECEAIDARELEADVESAPEENPAPVPQYFCPGCGAGYAEKINFCRSCGTKMSE